MASESLTLFFPCCNEAETIGEVVRQADAVARGFTADYEIIVVDDGSRDGSREVLLKLKAETPRLRLIFHEENQGYGAALLSGFRHATKDWVFYTDGDGQYGVSELAGFFPFLADGTDWINGYKLRREDPLYRRIIGRLYQGMARVFFDFHLRDLTCDFRLLRRRAFDKIQLQLTSAAICVELVKKLESAGFRALELPVHHLPRPHGRSRFFKPRHLWKMAVDLFALWRELNAVPRS